MVACRFVMGAVMTSFACKVLAFTALAIFGLPACTSDITGPPAESLTVTGVRDSLDAGTVTLDQLAELFRERGWFAFPSSDLFSWQWSPPEGGPPVEQYRVLWSFNVPDTSFTCWMLTGPCNSDTVVVYGLDSSARPGLPSLPGTCGSDTLR